MDAVLLKKSIEEGAGSLALLDETFVSIEKYIDNKIDISSVTINKPTASSRIRGRESKLSITSREKRFKRLVLTPLKSRIMLPFFGSRIHELIDQNMGFVWKIKLKKYLYECFFNENLELWDRDFDPVSIKIVDVNVEHGDIAVSMKFKNKMEVAFNV
jgi:hypothetical protein